MGYEVIAIDILTERSGLLTASEAYNTIIH